jgi:phosphoketolase
VRASLARDRMGIKPLYFYKDDEKLVFSSELRALLKSGLVKKKVSKRGLTDYLRYQTVHAPGTIIEHVYMLEPGRFRSPRTDGEQAHSAPENLRTSLYPDGAAACLFVSHTRPETMLGVLQALRDGRRAAGLGFINHGGTLDVGGMLFVNRCTWAHVLVESARLLRIDDTELLSDREADAINGKASPHGVVI